MKRTVSTSKAIEIAKKYLKKLGIKYKIEKFKTNHFTSIFISGKKDDIDFFSSGKGKGKKCLASGLFELLEHYFFENIKFNKIKLSKIPYSTNYIESIDYPLKTLKKIGGEEIDFFVVRGITNKKSALYPSFLSNKQSLDKLDDAKHFRLKQYFTNSGISMGVSYKEAFIHSFFEILERHSISMFILENFYLRNLKFENLIIDYDSLPKEYQDIFNTIIELTDEKPMIFNLSKYTKIQTFMVVAKNNKSDHPFLGAGCSITSNYALERALLECLQTIHMYNEEEIENENKIMDFNKKFPLLYKIYKFDYIEKNNIVLKYENIEFKGNINEIYKFILNYIKENKYNVYERVLYKNKGICCLQLIVLETSKLNTTFNGSFMIPTDEEIKRWSERSL